MRGETAGTLFLAYSEEGRTSRASSSLLSDDGQPAASDSASATTSASAGDASGSDSGSSSGTAGNTAVTPLVPGPVKAEDMARSARTGSRQLQVRSLLLNDYFAYCTYL